MTPLSCGPVAPSDKITVVVKKTPSSADLRSIAFMMGESYHNAGPTKSVSVAMAASCPQGAVRCRISGVF